MATNYHQARVHSTPKTQVNSMAPDESSLAPKLLKESVAKQTGPIPTLVPQKIREFPVADFQSFTKPPVDRSVEAGAGVIYQVGKRFFDIILGTMLLLVAIPIVLLAALAIRINTPGSPFFFQTRLGKNGKPFRIFKLRGMYIDARARFPAYYDYSHKQDLEFCFHHEEDPRVTRAGRFIRKTSIDELPNLWNVVTGDMSLVGPRPEIPEVMALYGGYRERYLSVKPGITCLSKCTGRDRLTKRETIEFDLDYIRRRKFSYDLIILWRTFRSVILRRDVF